jgi:nucleotide-binding universal stress UspA family protein
MSTYENAVPDQPIIDGAVYGRPDNWDEPVAIPALGATVQKLLVPFDGSAHGEVGLAHAVRVATWSGAEIIVCVAFDPPQRMKRRSMLPAESIVQAMEADAKELATETVQLLLDAGMKARGIVVRGDAADAILETIEQESVDMVVIGRRNIGSVRGVVMGSVSERIIRYAEVPVLVVA